MLSLVPESGHKCHPSTLRTSAKKGGWEGLCRGSRILQGQLKVPVAVGAGFSASLSVSIPLGLEYVFLQGL